MCRSRRKLSNAYLLETFGFDTAENEPCKVCPLSALLLLLQIPRVSTGQVLVTSFRPLKAYLYDQGFCRFCNEEYNCDVEDLDNMFVHLTNVAIQKESAEYNEQHGGKWSIDLMRMYLEATRGQQIADQLLEEIENVIVTSLRAVQGVMINDKHCFEMYAGL